MRRVMKWRYYCDFCGKGGASGGAMALHEKHCTMNPERECRMCDAAERAYGEEGQHPIPDLIAVLGDGERAGMAALGELANGCPACILAAIRQSGLREKDLALEREGVYKQGEDGYWVFDFKKKAEAWWSDYNDAMREQDCADYGGCF